VNTLEPIPNVTIPVGAIGDFRIERFTITEDQARLENMLSAFRASRRYVEAGEYTRLMRGETCVMSDTPSEKSDHREAVRKASGFILINGLGIGMVLNACLSKPEVTRAIVVEISREVIDLIGPYYQAKFGPRVEIVHADALTYQPPKGVRFGMVWHDIWDNICSDNLEQMATLHRRYGRRAEWQGSWCKELCQYYRSHSR